jgi:hypothetical protein
MTSVELWLKALGEYVLLTDLTINLTLCQDLLFERLHKNSDLSKIKAVSGAAQVRIFGFVLSCDGCHQQTVGAFSKCQMGP